MQAKEGVLERLNNILTMELTAINRYFLQAEMSKNWGYDRLYKKVRELSIGEMKDAEGLVGHILYLDGLPNVQRLFDVGIGESVHENLQIDLEAEKQIVVTLTEAITHCATVGDYTTRGMLEAIVHDEDTHVDWFETQLETIRQVGLENWLTEQMH